MNSDAYFTVSQDGPSHPICQDYARAGEKKGRRYAIGSDGCSTAVDTDWGSRLLVKSLEEQLFEHPSLGQAYQAAIGMAERGRSAFNLHETCLRATLLCAVEEENGIRAGIFGDGYLFARNKETGDYDIYKQEFTSGAPYYLAYGLLPAYKTDYIDKFGREGHNFVTEVATLTKDGLLDYRETVRQPVTEGMNFREIFYPSDQYDVVGFMSDGLHSFYTKVISEKSISPESVEINKILPELLAFKGTAGRFVLRRSLKAFEVFEKNGWYNKDDFSMGVVHG